MRAVCTVGLNILLLVVANIFTSAWELSAMTAQSKVQKERFFSNVFGVYEAIAFVVGSGLILTAQFATRLLAAPSYFEAWRFIPVLVLATALACLGSFLASIYMLEKRSVATLTTTLLGAGANIAGNLWLIPKLGIMGAAIATLGSYALIFVVRAVHTRTMLRLRWSVPKLLGCFGLLAVQCVLMKTGAAHWPVWSVLCFLAILLLNRKPLLQAIRKVV